MRGQWRLGGGFGAYIQIHRDMTMGLRASTPRLLLTTACVVLVVTLSWLLQSWMLVAVWSLFGWMFMLRTPQSTAAAGRVFGFLEPRISRSLKKLAAGISSDEFGFFQQFALSIFALPLFASLWLLLTVWAIVARVLGTFVGVVTNFKGTAIAIPKNWTTAVFRTGLLEDVSLVPGYRPELSVTYIGNIREQLNDYKEEERLTRTLFLLIAVPVVFGSLAIAWIRFPTASPVPIDRPPMNDIDFDAMLAYLKRFEANSSNVSLVDWWDLENTDDLEFNPWDTDAWVLFDGNLNDIYHHLIDTWVSQEWRTAWGVTRSNEEIHAEVKSLIETAETRDGRPPTSFNPLMYSRHDRFVDFMRREYYSYHHGVWWCDSTHIAGDDPSSREPGPPDCKDISPIHYLGWLNSWTYLVTSDARKRHSEYTQPLRICFEHFGTAPAFAERADRYARVRIERAGIKWLDNVRHSGAWIILLGIIVIVVGGTAWCVIWSLASPFKMAVLVSSVWTRIFVKATSLVYFPILWVYSAPFVRLKDPVASIEETLEGTWSIVRRQYMKIAGVIFIITYIVLVILNSTGEALHSPWRPGIYPWQIAMFLCVCGNFATWLLAHRFLRRARQKEGEPLLNDLGRRAASLARLINTVSRAVVLLSVYITVCNIYLIAQFVWGTNIVFPEIRWVVGPW